MTTIINKKGKMSIISKSKVNGWILKKINNRLTDQDIATGSGLTRLVVNRTLNWHLATEQTTEKLSNFFNTVK